MGNALDRARAAQAENEALKVSAQETTAALQETTAELKDLKGELKWLQLHIKREQELARDQIRQRDGRSKEVSMTADPKGRGLFIVDNSVTGWTGLRYLEEWAGGGFVPVGQMAARLPGIDGRTRSMSVNTRNHFTVLKQIDQLIEASDAEPDLGFMARLMCLCSLPRTNPRQRTQYVRRNGPYTLVMSATGDPARLPYGNIPRLLLAWVCTEAVRTQSRELVLGRSLYEFMRRLGMEDRSGGVNGQRTRLRNQMTRLFRCSVQLQQSDGDHEVTVSSLIADKSEYWWHAAEGSDRPGLFDSTIRLGEEFFNEILAHPVPLDMHILRSLKRSPLGLDLYVWLVYRTFTLRAPLCLSWRQVLRQFGADPAKESRKNSV